jgi:flagellar motor switch protein FliN/FliY
VIEALGRHVARSAAESLGLALGHPNSIGPATVRQTESGEIESEDWETYHPIDVRWEAGGASYAPLLLLPKAALQTVLPAAPGPGDLPDMEALGQLLRDLAGAVSAAAQQHFAPPIAISLPDAGAAPHDEHDTLLRIEHTVTAGTPGAETVFTVVHLVPADALQMVAVQSDTGSIPATPSGSPAAGGGFPTLEDTMTSAAQPSGAGTSVHPVQFQAFEGDSVTRGGTNLDLLLDVSLRVSVELGRTDLTIKEVLALGPGSVIELDKLAGEPVDILVNDRLIAKGEVVVVDENFGVRVTDIMSPEKRIAKVR